VGVSFRFRPILSKDGLFTTSAPIGEALATVDVPSGGTVQADYLTGAFLPLSQKGSLKIKLQS
jgi:hypothetical protein